MLTTDITRSEFNCISFE